MWGRLIGLLQDVGMPTAILAALVIAVLAGYALAMLRAILKEIRDLKAEIREVRAQAQVDRKAAEDRPEEIARSTRLTMIGCSRRSLTCRPT